MFIGGLLNATSELRASLVRDRVKQRYANILCIPVLSFSHHNYTHLLHLLPRAPFDRHHHLVTLHLASLNAL